VKATFSQRARLRRHGLRLLDETTPAILQSRGATAEELESVCDAMRAIPEDRTTLMVQARVAQVRVRTGERRG
jgi:hypothetical protein